MEKKRWADWQRNKKEIIMVVRCLIAIINHPFMWNAYEKSSPTEL